MRLPQPTSRARTTTAALLTAAVVAATAVLAGPAVTGGDDRRKDRSAVREAIADRPVSAKLHEDRRVLAISVDGLRSSVVGELGAAELPALHRLLEEGASTLDARTTSERTETLPNHTSMLTSRRVDASKGGHGVTWNTDESGRTVQGAAGEKVQSVFTKVWRAGGTTALFTGKSKFSLFKRSWGRAVQRYLLAEDPDVLVRKARRDLRKQTRTFTFLHLSAPDVAGHASGWDSEEYLDAVRRVDEWLADLLDTVASKPVLRKHLTILLTADHGGSGTSHVDPTVRAHFRIPFLAWGDGVRAGDLYDLNDDYKKPGRKRPSYAKPKQPVRNAAVGNLALDLLGLGAIPRSEVDADQDLDVR